ncbi:MAG TPA: hypothetical protein VNK96_02905 [Fimbriimonadales bacterium]|nr:hypothetical protein [Fimbriimonadales bacterium]
MSSRNLWQRLLDAAFPRRASGHPHLASFFAAIRKRKPDPKSFLNWGIPFTVLLLGFAAAYLIFPKNLLGYIAMIGTALLSSILLWLGLRSTQTEEERSQSALRKKAMQLEERLNSWKYLLGFETPLSKGALLLLEEAARYWHDVDEVFHSPIWHSEEILESWRAARDRARHAMDSAMLKLLELAEEQSPRLDDPISSVYQSSAQTVSEMRNLASEVARLTVKLNTKVTRKPETPEQRLREVLASFKKLESAEEELDNFQET